MASDASLCFADQKLDLKWAGFYYSVAFSRSRHSTLQGRSVLVIIQVPAFTWCSILGTTLCVASIHCKPQDVGVQLIFGVAVVRFPCRSRCLARHPMFG
jgi:hypothetical protein